MRNCSQIGKGAVLLIVLSVCAVRSRGQSEPNQATSDDAPAFRAVIDSAQSCWRLNADATHPGGPGKWSRSAVEHRGASVAGGKRSRTHQLVVPAASNRLAIQQGDLLLVEEHSEFAEGFVRAIALEAARRGEMIG